MMLFGRRKIYTASEQITKDNVISEVNAALSIHSENIKEEEFLYWYRRGMQPILDRTKEVRPEICNKIVVNNADMIVNFKNGYFITENASYISRKDDEKVTDEVKQLNEYLYISGKHRVDNEVVDWFHTVGLGALYVEPSTDADCPFNTYALDPRSAFVVYSLRPGNKPVMGINVVISEEDVCADVYTETAVFKLYGRRLDKTENKYGIRMNGLFVSQIVSEDKNRIGKIPIVEYAYNANRMGAFENAIDLMNAINLIESNRADGIEQFIQSLVIMYNCELDEGTTANSIRKAGLIQLKNVGDNKADIKILSEQLDQSQTQTTLDNLYEQMLDKVGVPSSIRDSGSTSDNVGAVYLRSGWAMADTDARNAEDEFKKSNALFDDVILAILKKRGISLKKSDFELKIIRNSANNLLVKTQAALNLKELGFAPAIAFERSGLSSDPLADVEASKEYIDVKWTTVIENVEPMMPNGGDNNEPNNIQEDTQA